VHDSIYAEHAIKAEHASTIHLSVCPSHGWISQKWWKSGSCNFHHRV